MALSINSLRQAELAKKPTITKPKIVTPTTNSGSSYTPQNVTMDSLSEADRSLSGFSQQKIIGAKIEYENAKAAGDTAGMAAAHAAADAERGTNAPPVWLNTDTDPGANPPPPGGDTAPPPQLQTPQLPETPDPSIAINELKQAQIQANMAALDKSLGNQITNVNTQYAGIDQRAYDARNVAAGESDVAAMNFAQRAASRGIQGNAASIPEIYRNSALQGRLGKIDQGALANKNILDTQKTNLQNAYESDRVGIQSSAEAQALQNLISQQNANRQFALSEAGVTGQYGGQTTIQGQSQMYSNQKAQLDIAAQEIANSYLPQTLKDEATILQQQVESGKIDIATALAQLNQIGKQYPEEYVNQPTIDMLETYPDKIKPVEDQIAKLMIDGKSEMAVEAIMVKYQNGSLKKSEANYLLSQFGFSTIG